MPVAQQLVGAVLHPRGDVGVGRAAVGRVVFEAAVLRRIVRGRDDDAVGQVIVAAAVVGEDGAGDHRRRREAVLALNHRLDAVGREHLERRALRRLRQARACPCPCRAGRRCPARWRYSQIACVMASDVRFGERAVAATSRDGRWCRSSPAGSGHPGPACARSTPLRADKIDQDRGRRRLAGERRDGRALRGVAIGGLLHPRLLSCTDDRTCGFLTCTCGFRLEPEGCVRRSIDLRQPQPSG